MGTPTFYWYPNQNGGPSSVDLGEELSDLPVQAEVIGEPSPLPGHGVVALGIVHRVEIVLEDFGSGTNGTLAAQLEPMIAHLQVGGLVGFGRDSAKLFAARLPRKPTAGTTTIRPLSNIFTSWNASAALADNDRIILEEPFPGHRREYVQVNGTPSATAIVLDSPGTVYAYETPPIARYEDFWPVLYLDPKADPGGILTSERRRIWTLRLPLIWSPNLAASLWRPPGVAFPSLDTVGLTVLRSGTVHQGATLESAVRPRVSRSLLMGGPRIHNRGWIS